MAATRENVLAAITQYVADHKRRAPAKAIAELVGDSLPNVQSIIKALVGEGAIESSRGRNGGAKPVSASTQAPEAQVDADGGGDDVASQFAALVAQLEQDSESQAAVG